MVSRLLQYFMDTHLISTHRDIFLVNLMKPEQTFVFSQFSIYTSGQNILTMNM